VYFLKIINFYFWTNEKKFDGGKFFELILRKFHLFFYKFAYYLK